MILGDRHIQHSWGKIIPERQSGVFAAAAWANEQERKLLKMHCGQMLNRARHMQWAETVIGRD